MKKIFFIAALLLAGCASVQPNYEAKNYQTLSWAKESFDQAKATCRYQNLNHEWLGDSYELETPKYKACMEQQGFRFTVNAQ